jgi:hypothetical protein
MNANKAARIIQTRWRTAKPRYFNPFNRLGPNITAQIALLASPSNRRAFVQALRPPSNLERTIAQAELTRKKRRAKLQGLLYSAARVGRVVPSGPQDRLYRTLRSFTNAKRKLNAGGRVTHFLGNSLERYPQNQKNFEKQIRNEYKHIMRHLFAPNSNYTNDKPPNKWKNDPSKRAIWRAMPMHKRRWVKFIENNVLNGNYTENNMSYFKVNGVPLKY